MSQPDMLRQVLLRREVDGRAFEDVYWIRLSLAQVGKRVKDRQGKIYTVKEIYGARPGTDLDMMLQTHRDFERVLDSDADGYSYE